MHTSAMLLVVLVVLAASAGCSADPVSEPSAPASADGTALIAPEALAAHVPAAPDGWRLAAPPSSAVLDEDGALIASVTASYLSLDGARTTDLTLQDTGGRPVGLRRLADDLAAASENGTAPAPTLLGGRAAHVVETGEMAGACTVVVDRYVVWIAVAGGNRAEIEAFCAGLDLDALADLQ